MVHPTSVTTGTVDTRENAYGGLMLRGTELAYDSGDAANEVLQERIITSYDPTTLTFTVDPAFSPVPSTADGDCKFEVVPAYHSDLELAICLITAELLIGSSGDTKRMVNLQRMRKDFFRTVKIRISNYENRYGDRFEGDTWDNDRYTPWYFGSLGR